LPYFKYARYCLAWPGLLGALTCSGRPPDVAVLGHQQVGHQAGDPAQQAAVVVVDAVQRHRHDPHLVTAVQQRQMDPYAVVVGHLDRDRVEKAASRVGVVDQLRLRVREALAGQGYEHQLAVVLQQHLRMAAPQLLHHVGDQGPDAMRRKLVRAVENRSQQRFPEALGAVLAPSGHHPLTRHDPRASVAAVWDDEEIARAMAPPRTSTTGPASRSPGPDRVRPLT
jgi:hypothetical protein